MAFLLLAGLALVWVRGQESRPAATAAEPPSLADATGTATFAGGCFWCVESAFDGVE
ncbi:MAG: peptide-methionine (S)-S-oxide reductase, partial [Xanthomonadales bacterium]|nr:peptide-methionine (S)-S-oxide reductase [Xanthomonadales bacterium]NIP75309.1 peptide-methionine (S)-S-oxide reductase [Xanthomonadales bacterium]